MSLSSRLVRHQTGVLQGVIEVHDLQAVLEAEPPHVFQARRPINQHHHLARTAQTAAQGLLAQQRAERVNGLETGNIGRGFMVSHRMALVIGVVLGEHAPQVNLAGFGRAVGLLAAPPLEFFGGHRHARAVLVDIENRGIAGAGLGLPLLPDLKTAVCTKTSNWATALPWTSCA